MAADTFLIAAKITGSNPDDWTTVESLLASVSGGITLRALEWEYQSYAEKVVLGNGQDLGRGYATARWSFGGLRPEQRENLRDFCTGLSAEVYIRTPTNETAAGVRTWGDFLAIAHWTEGPELVEVNHVSEPWIAFTHLVAV